jgi:hypothetical protein
MPIILISEKQFEKLVETAQDLDRYVQLIDYDSSNGNEGLEVSIKGSIDELNELLSMFKTGKKIYPNTESKIHKILDDIKSIHLEVKTEN